MGFFQFPGRRKLQLPHQPALVPSFALLPYIILNFTPYLQIEHELSNSSLAYLSIKSFHKKKKKHKRTRQKCIHVHEINTTNYHVLNARRWKRIFSETQVQIRFTPTNTRVYFVLAEKIWTSECRLIENRQRIAIELTNEDNSFIFRANTQRMTLFDCIRLHCRDFL